MGWLAGILSGYADRHHEIRAENAALDAQAAQREADIYKQLLNSDDPEIQGMAATGIMQMGQPRRGQSGFAGWMGKMQSSPIYPTLMKYMSTPKQVDREVKIPGLPTTSKTGYTSLMPEVKGSLSLPATSPTEGGPVTPPQPLPTPPPAPPQFEPPAAPAALAANPDPGILQQVPPGTTVGADPGIHAQIPPGTTVGADPGILATPPPTPPAAAAPGARRNIFAFAPPAAPAAEAVAAPAAAAPLPSTSTGPPVPPSVFTTQQVPGPTVGRTDVTTTYETPHFPTEEERATKLALAKERADYLAAVEMFARNGDPDPEKSASDFIVASKTRATGGSFKPVEVEFLGPDGQIRRALASFNTQTSRYHDMNGNPLPADAQMAAKGSGRAYNKREEIAAAKFGKEGEDPIAVNRRLRPKERAIVLREEGILAAEAALAKAEAMQNAPLTTLAKSNLTEKLAGEWQEVNKPQLALKVQLDRMKVGLDRYDQDPNGASQVILMTFNKLLDPDSVVREGEYDRSKHGVGVLNQIQGWWEKYGGRIDTQTGRLIAGGAAIPIADLREMAETARQFSVGLADHTEEQRQRIEFRAGQHMIDPRGIFGGPPPPAVAEVPKVGATGGATAGATGGGATTTPAAPAGKPRFEKDEKGNWTVVR